MRYLFDQDSNSLVITFADGRRYRDSEEISDGVVVDFDAEGRPYAIEFLRADRFVDVSGLVSGRPVRVAPSAAVANVERALAAIDGDAHEESLRQALQDVTAALQAYLKNEPVPLKLASGGRST